MLESLPFYAYKGDKPYIFISYSHQDSVAVFSIIGKFYEMGYNIWYDEGIDPGNEWPEEIGAALNACALFIVFISPRSVASENVRNEINFALAKKLPVIVIYLEETDLTVGLQLQIGSKQAIMKHNMTEDSFYYKCNKSFERIVLTREVREKTIDTSESSNQNQRDISEQSNAAVGVPMEAESKRKEAGHLKAEGKRIEAEKFNPDDIDSVRRAAERGHSEAQNSLGDIYYRDKDYHEAVKWYRKSAEQDNAKAQYSLGWCYYHSMGVENDNKEAVRWYRKAVNHGYNDAMYDLGVCYEEGRGVLQDLTEAVTWYRRAAAGGHAYAERHLEILGYSS
jgi:tetratricopeptide (TPR) repeat protein